MPNQPVNILLVDDNSANLLALEAILGSLGQNLVKAKSGREALKHLLYQDFAVILLDVQMPEMDGFETAEMLRSRPKTECTPIIFLTAFSKSEQFVFKGYDAGAVDYLFKPIVPEILRSKVAVFIDLFNKTAEINQQAVQLANANKILQQAHDELDLRVRERTAELVSTNEDLRLEVIERRHVETALRESEERFRVMANNAPVMIWMTGVDARCSFFNQGWLDFTGQTLEQSLEEGWTGGIYADDLPHCLDIFITAFHELQSFEMEFRLKRADGAYSWILSRGTPRFKPDGSFVGYIGSCIDISDRKSIEQQREQTEAELQRINTDLEQRVAERTRQLLEVNDQLEARVVARTAELQQANDQLKREIRERQRAEEEVRFLQAMTQIAIESQDFYSALALTLEKMCEATDWAMGEAWIPNADKSQLECSPIWYSRVASDLEGFRASSQDLAFPPGVGLPGRVWASKQPEWRRDVSSESATVYLRAQAAQDAGLKAALGIPIIAQHQVLAVLVFYMVEAREQDGRVIELISALTALGLMIQHKQIEGNQNLQSIIVRNIAEGVCVIRASDGVIIYANPKFEQMFGYKADELNGQPVTVLNYEEDEGIAAHTHAVIAQEVDQLGQYSYEVHNVKKDGTPFWGKATSSTFEHPEHGNVYVSVQEDITQRKQMEEALRQSEATNRAIISAIPDHLLRLGRDGTYLTLIKDGNLNLIGGDRIAIGANIYDILPAAMSQERMYYVEQALQTGETQVYEYEIAVDGNNFFEEARIAAIGDETVLLMVRDISERKRSEAERIQAEADLRESQRFVQKIADTAPVLLYVYDLIEKRNVYINREVTELLGYSLEEIQSMGSKLLQTLIHPDDVGQVLSRDEHWVTAREGEIIQTEYRMQHQNGEWRYFQTQGTLFARTPDGLPKQILGVAIDITPIKQLEELRRAEEQLQISLREKDVLLKEIHHRVKNNLQIIYSLLRLQHRRVKDFQASEILMESRNRVKSIALIHEKLYRSKDLAKIKLAQYIPSLAAYLFSSYSINSNTVSLHTHIDDLTLDIDTAIPCGLIINELVSNSLKYAFPHNRVGKICIELRKNPDYTLTLIVQDDGIGISADFDLATAPSLGLKLVRDLASQLGGSVIVDRVQGTQFIINFPLNNP